MNPNENAMNGAGALQMLASWCEFLETLPKRLAAEIYPALIKVYAGGEPDMASLSPQAAGFVNGLRRSLEVSRRGSAVQMEAKEEKSAVKAEVFVETQAEVTAAGEVGEEAAETAPVANKEKEKTKKKDFPPHPLYKEKEIKEKEKAAAAFQADESSSACEGEAAAENLNSTELGLKNENSDKCENASDTAGLTHEPNTGKGAAGGRTHEPCGAALAEGEQCRDARFVRPVRDGRDGCGGEARDALAEGARTHEPCVPTLASELGERAAGGRTHEPCGAALAEGEQCRDARFVRPVSDGRDGCGGEARDALAEGARTHEPCVPTLAVKGGGEAMGARGAREDYAEFMKYFNKTLAAASSAIPPVRALPERRRELLRKRMREHGREKVEEMVRLAAESPFLNGGGKRGFTATLDWLLDAEHFVRVLEGQYNHLHQPVKQTNHAKTDKLTQETPAGNGGVGGRSFASGLEDDGHLYDYI